MTKNLIMLGRNRVFALARASALALLATHALAQTPDVRELMTPEEFSAAGLEQLSPEQLDALNSWVLRYTARDAPQLRQHNDVVREEIARVDSQGTRTRIVGEFRGWNGETVFRLENGQTWKQRLSGRWFYRATNPEVELRKNYLGFWVLRVVDADRSVGVTRID